MLGVRRTSVSVCAHTLQKSGLVHYARGNIKIKNRKGLEECACECYAAIRDRSPADGMMPSIRFIIEAPASTRQRYWFRPGGRQTGNGRKPPSRNSRVRIRLDERLSF